MIRLETFGSFLKDCGIDFLSGVPCSSLQGLINYSISHFSYVGTTGEAESVAVASGAFLGGKKSAVLLQNSGLPGALDPFTSLNATFKIPILGFVGLRGEPGADDQPQHALIGSITEKLLTTCSIPTFFLSTNEKEVREQLDHADCLLEQNKSVFFIVRKGTFYNYSNLKERMGQKNAPTLIRSKYPKEWPLRARALEIISEQKNGATVVLTTTGHTSRELFEIADSPQHFYMVGSMGCVSSIALGLAMSKPTLKVIAIDGDGALLMRMGLLATNGFYRPPNLLHVLIDNEAHESTGGQATVSADVDFPAIAASSGYPMAIETNTIEEFSNSITEWKVNPKLTFISLKVRKAEQKIFPRVGVSPEHVKARFMNFIEEVTTERVGP